MSILFPALLLLAPFAPAQTLGRVVVTEGNHPAVHLRPAAWQPLQQDSLSAIGSDIEIAYSVTFTNQNAAPVTFSSTVGFGAVFVNGGHYPGGSPCWGGDFFQDDYWHVVDLPVPVTLDPGQSQTLTGTGFAPSVQWQGAPYSGSFCVEDGLHGTLNMRIWPPVGRTVPAWRAGAGPFGTIYGTDHGSVVVQHDMRITGFAVVPVRLRAGLALVDVRWKVGVSPPASCRCGESLSRNRERDHRAIYGTRIVVACNDVHLSGLVIANGFRARSRRVGLGQSEGARRGGKENQRDYRSLAEGCSSGRDL